MGQIPKESGRISTCRNCSEAFTKRAGNQIYCGSKTQKTGCSYEKHKQCIYDYNTGKGKENMKRLQNEWKKKQRLTDSDYAKRQREIKRRRPATEEGKKKTSDWRKKNIDRVLEYNRKREIKKKGVKGSHTLAQWNKLKKDYLNRCAHCFVSEKNLKGLYPDSRFHKLTRDHVVPISKGGTDYIHNIQPLCISCNAKKNNKHHIVHDLPIVAVSGGFDPLHVGHLEYFEHAKRIADSIGGVVVCILNSDNFLKHKKGKEFMKFHERRIILNRLSLIDEVIPCIDKDQTVCETLRMLKPALFCKGGDRFSHEIPETKVCESLGITIVDGLGDKIQSSSELVRKAK